VCRVKHPTRGRPGPAWSRADRQSGNGSSRGRAQDLIRAGPLAQRNRQNVGRLCRAGEPLWRARTKLGGANLARCTPCRVLARVQLGSWRITPHSRRRAWRPMASGDRLRSSRMLIMRRDRLRTCRCTEASKVPTKEKEGNGSTWFHFLISYPDFHRYRAGESRLAGRVKTDSLLRVPVMTATPPNCPSRARRGMFFLWRST